MDFSSVDIVYKVLKIDIHRYTDTDASVSFFEKKKTTKTKQTNKRSFNLFEIFLLSIMSISFDNFSCRQLQMFVITVYGN